MHILLKTSLSILILFLIIIVFELCTGFNFHKLFNKKLYECTDLSINTSDCNNNCKLVIKHRILEGKLKASKSKVVICGLARNIEKLFNILKERLEKTGSYFLDYKIVLFENNSNDNTRNLLKKWSNDNKNVILLECCSLGNCGCHLKKLAIDKNKIGMFETERMRKMALYRNKYLD